MRLIVFLLFFLSGMFVKAQKYNYSTIPDSLQKNANAVKRLEETVYEIKSPGNAVLHEHRIYTIFNESADRYGSYISYYDKFISINSISGSLYDKSGKELKHVKKKDMSDVSGTGEESLITDARYKVNDFYYREYPYTVEYEEEDKVDGVRSFPHWIPQSDPLVAVELSRYVIIAPKNYVVRYKELNFSTPPVITESSDKRTYTWEIRSLPATIQEVYSPAWTNIMPYVMLAPSAFEAEGYKGDMGSWEDYGKFIYQLVKGRDVLPEDIKKKVHELTDGLKDNKSKIAALYEFLQKNTRYVSVQLGIGGWQPFDANYVATKRYGDCKALSNYMVALLKEAGITGKYVEIRAGEHAAPIISDFAESQFNHVICCVPLGKDTVWLECTSESLPAGYLSGFTSDRFALIIDESGGKLVRTPKYGLADNLATRQINAVVNEEGNLTAITRTVFKGGQQDVLESYISELSKERLLKYLKSSIRLPTYDIVKFDYEQDKTALPSVTEDLEINANNYAQTSGKRLFINPNILNRSTHRIENTEHRKYDIVINDEFRDIDSVNLQIPTGFIPESLPKDISIENEFGKFITRTKVSSDKITYYRLQEQVGGRFPAKDFPDMVKYYETIYKADQQQVVMVKSGK